MSAISGNWRPWPGGTITTSSSGQSSMFPTCTVKTGVVEARQDLQTRCRYLAEDLLRGIRGWKGWAVQAPAQGEGDCRRQQGSPEGLGLGLLGFAWQQVGRPGTSLCPDLHGGPHQNRPLWTVHPSPPLQGVLRGEVAEWRCSPHSSHNLQCHLPSPQVMGLSRMERPVSNLGQCWHRSLLHRRLWGRPWWHGQDEGRGCQREP